MKRASIITYESVKTINDKTYSFLYTVDSSPYSIDVVYSQKSSLPNDVKKNILINIGMTFLLDLAEIVLPKRISIEIPFTENEALFWEEVYKNIALEKVFMEKYEPEILSIPWIITHPRKAKLFYNKKHTSKILLCVSGGKESLTAIKLLEKQVDLSLFISDTQRNIHTRKAHNELKNIFPIISCNSTEENVKKELMARYSQNHYGAFIIGRLIFHCLLYSDRYINVCLGNELSAQFGNTTYKGYTINHQYTKTLSFAKKINEYIRKFITPDFSYFSPFFGVYEYKIMELFLKDNKYLALWTSCNRAKDEQNFCGKCFKCSFLYILALVHKDKSFLAGYFPNNLLQNLFLTLPLMHLDAIKPFECIGEKKEVWVALQEIYRQRKDLSSPTMQYFRRYIYPYIKKDLPIFKKEISAFYPVKSFF